MKRFAVIGLGHFGMSVAKKLYEEGREVIAVDADKERVQDAAEFSEQSICVDATDKQTLENLELNDVDAAIVSLGERMDVITLAALHLKEIGVPYLIVKAISADHEKILRAIGVNEVIHPEEFAAQSLATRLSLFGVSDFLPVLPNYSVVLLKTPQCFTNQTVSVMESKSVQVVAIQRANEMILTPSDQDILRPDDMLILLGENQNLNRLAERIERE
ncbi:MAG: TrkA family potassium uptake protein [Blastocatellia bacterium]|nr:TrkA family potassium uptake protein [Blastocatellia bacterium]